MSAQGALEVVESRSLRTFSRDEGAALPGATVR